MSKFPSISWKLVEKLELDAFLPNQPHIFNALVVGITERIAQHDAAIADEKETTNQLTGEEWAEANLEELKRFIKEAACYSKALPEECCQPCINSGKECSEETSRQDRASEENCMRGAISIATEGTHKVAPCTAQSNQCKPCEPYEPVE